MSDSIKLKVRVRTTQDTVWEGEGESVSSINSQGPFDVLAGHAQMVTLVEGKIIKVHNGHDTTDFKFDRAVLHVHDNVVTIYASED